MDTGADFNISRGARGDMTPCWLDTDHLLIQTNYGLVVVDPISGQRRAISGSQNRSLRPICNPGSATFTFVDNQAVEMTSAPLYELNSSWTELTTVPHRTTTFLDSQLILSPDGTAFLYVADAIGEGRRLMREQIADGTSQLVYQAASTITEPVWSPDMRHIAFGSATDLWVIDADGQNAINLTTSVRSEARQWTWSPDSTLIAYSILSGGVSNILVSSIETESMINLTPDQGMCFEPHWGLDGRTLLITCQGDRDLNVDVYAVDIVTRAITRTSFVPARDSAPAWRP
ncbi:MAG: hypothetical protein U0670_05565 [Anaerolineae bacterium]